MHKISRINWNMQIGKWIASLLTVTLLVNQNSFWVLAEENGNEVCCCDARCSVNSVNEACPVCTEDYGTCGGTEIVADAGTDTETVPDNATDEKTENSDAGTDTATDEEVTDSDTDESVNTDADSDTVTDIATEEENIFLQDDEADNIIEDDAAGSAAEDGTFTDSTFTYKILSDNENSSQVELTGLVGGTSVSGAIVIPPTASDGTNEYAVVSIGRRAFYDCSSLTSITIPDSVTIINNAAFSNCSSVTNFTIPNSVTKIGRSAFNNCNSLTSITIPSGVTSIEQRAFRYCRNLKSVIMHDGITVIEQSAFSCCDSLESVIIPNGVTIIEDDAFSICENLRSVTISGNVTSIGSATFGFAPNLESVTILNDHISFDDGAFIGTKLNCFQIAVSEDVTATPTVGDLCFYDVPLGENTFLTFVTKDGTTKLSDITVPTLAEAVEAYNAVDDGGINDGYWYGWRLPEVTDETNYPVTIKVNKDGSEWTDCGKAFVLSPDNGGTFITDLTAVSNGTYIIYDITGASDSTGYAKTGVTVEVKDAATQAEINYYSVTFYDGDTPFSGQIVPGNTTVSEPLPPPTKDGYTFYRWATSKDGSTEFVFKNPITAKTDIYASWIVNAEEPFTITASAGAGGSVTPSGEIRVKSGANQEFTITPEDGYRIASVLVDGNEVLGSIQTRDYSKAGLTDAGNNIKYYNFENVTSNHTLMAYFETIQTGDNGSESSGGGNSGDNSVSDGSDSSVGDNTEVNSVSDSSGGNTPATNTDTSVSADISVISISNTAPASKDNEPKTGYASYMEIYATIAMIAGLSYLLLYFMDGKSGMTEDEKKEIVADLVKWAKKGKRFRKYAALAIIFMILVYYHSIGKRTSTDWKEVYER